MDAYDGIEQGDGDDHQQTQGKVIEHSSFHPFSPCLRCRQDGPGRFLSGPLRPVVRTALLPIEIPN
jgi:hypothetical protein